MKSAIAAKDECPGSAPYRPVVTMTARHVYRDRYRIHRACRTAGEHGARVGPAIQLTWLTGRRAPTDPRPPDPLRC